jgi:hypothetical protein
LLESPTADPMGLFDPGSAGTQQTLDSAVGANHQATRLPRISEIAYQAAK